MFVEPAGSVITAIMGRDRRTYRFLRDTRLGRVVLAESHEIKPVADQVTRYIAERIVERQRMIDGDVEPVLVSTKPAEPQPEAIAKQPSGWRSFLSGLMLVLVGAAVGLVATAALLWDKLAALGFSF